MVSFTRGIVNGTKTPTTQNLTVCEQRIIKKWNDNALKIVNYTLAGDLFKVGWALLDMIYNIDPIAQSCYKGFSESAMGIYGYGTQLDPKTVMDNVIFSFGHIFDSLRDVVLFFTDDARGEFNLPYDAGYGLGTAIYLVMKPPNKK